MTPRTGPTAWRQWAGQRLEERDRRRDRREGWLLLLAILFVVANAATLGVTTGDWSWPRFVWPAVWLLVSVAAHLSLSHFKPHRDPFLLPVFVLLAGWGLLLQDRLAPNFLGRQTLWYVLATAALLLVAIVPRSLQPLTRYRYVLLLSGLLLVGITLIFGVNPSGGGAALWLSIPVPFLDVVYFQPSELLKLVMVIFLASYFTEREPLYRYNQQRHDGEAGPRRNPIQRLRHQLPFLGPLALMWGFCLLLLVWQQDLGAAGLFFIVFVALLYLATGRRFYVWSGLLLLVAVSVIAFFAFNAVAPRVLTWLNPWPNANDEAYQVVQSLFAQASGGIFGRGAGQGFPDYIPVVHSDFALAAIAEEWGLLGSLSVVFALALFTFRGLRAALLSLQGFAPRYFNAYLAAGIVVLFAIQAMLIIGGVIKLLPLTGITLPFISYGGSSLLISSIMVGLLIHLSAANDATLAPTRAFDPRLARRIERLGLALLIGLGVVGLTLAYWSSVRSEALAAHPDNPRLVEAERRVRRGQIVDQGGRVLAESVGQTGALARVYPLAEGGPAVGYYSVRFGAAGIERAYDDTLRGHTGPVWDEAWRAMLHLSPVGRDVRLTLDAELQAVAAQAMDGQVGGLVLLELSPGDEQPRAAIRAHVSQPAYDPNLPAEQFEALAADPLSPLFDRAAQGLYQPGLVLLPFLTAAAVDGGYIDLGDRLSDPFAPITLDGRVQRCVERGDEGNPAARYTWADLAALRCPAPLQALGPDMGADGLAGAFERFGLTAAPALPIPTGGGPADIDDPALAAIGQAGLTVTPLQVALATATLAADGRRPTPLLVEAVTDAGGQWREQPSALVTEAAVSPAVATAVRATWPRHDNVAEFAVAPLSGPDGHRNSWYLGFAPAEAPRYVVALVLEERNDLTAAEAVGRAVLAAAGP